MNRSQIRARLLQDEAQAAAELVHALDAWRKAQRRHLRRQEERRHFDQTNVIPRRIRKAVVLEIYREDADGAMRDLLNRVRLEGQRP